MTSKMILITEKGGQYHITEQGGKTVKILWKAEF